MKPVLQYLLIKVRLNRNIGTCPRKIKHLAYTTLVCPVLEYASIIWDPHTASNIHKLETVQRRSARHIMHNYNRHASVTTMLQHLNLPTLQQRCQHFKIIVLYRITHQLANIPTATYIAPSTTAQRYHNLYKHCNPHQHSVGVGLHAQPGLSGHLTLTSIISYTLCTTK